MVARYLTRIASMVLVLGSMYSFGCNRAEDEVDLPENRVVIETKQMLVPARVIYSNCDPGWLKTTDLYRDTIGVVMPPCQVTIEATLMGQQKT